MILAKLTDAKDYIGIHPRLDRAIEHLNPQFLETVSWETQKLDGDALYVTGFEYETSFENDVFEAHKKYLDVHLLLSGEERIEIAHPHTLELFDQKDDFYAYHGKAEQTVVLRPGNFLVVFPGDAHRIKLPVNDPTSVSKVVFKILVND